VSTLAIKGERRRVLGLGGVLSQLRQIYMDYSLAVPFRDIAIDEIHFFYEPLIEGLMKLQKDTR
jgi:hypothetical protein